MDIKHIPSAENLRDFYPTPRALADEMLKDIKWNDVYTILEPSAGKGDLIEAVEAAIKRDYTARDNHRSIHCVEIDPNLQAILRSKGYKLIHDDFLTFGSPLKYDLVIMNPPFSNGAAHLLKALTHVRPGGCVICLLNAETLRNPCTNERKRLKHELDRMHTVITFKQSAFQDAERRTEVEIAIIRAIREAEELRSIILEELRKAIPDPRQLKSEVTDLARRDLQSLIDLYRFESETGIRFLQEYEGLKNYTLDGTAEYASPIIKLEVNGSSYWQTNDYLRALRRKYWHALFSRSDFTERLTSNVANDLHRKVEKLADYEFSAFNIEQMERQLSQNVRAGILASIHALFDDWSRYALYDGSQNVHYYNGWKHNKAHKIAGKIIIPYYSEVWSDIWKKFRPSHGVTNDISDMQTVFDHLMGNEPDLYSITKKIKWIETSQQTRNILFRYFKVSFFKKRTIHITFTDEEALHRFNREGALHRNWLPPSYGSSRYADMAPDERQAVDEFEGRDAYEAWLDAPDHHLASGQLCIAADE